MTDKKTVGISSLIALGIVLASIITPTFFDNSQFYCEVESSIKECPGNLSGGTGTRCYLNEEKTSWDYCKSGWILVTDDLIIQEEEPEEPEEIIIIPNKQRQGYQNRYSCTPINCTEVLYKNE